MRSTILESSNELTRFTSGRTIILDRSVNAGVIIIQNGGKLIFKDNGKDGDLIKLRAKAIKVQDGGELWVGSRAHRYQVKGRNIKKKLY